MLADRPGGRDTGRFARGCGRGFRAVCLTDSRARTALPASGCSSGSQRRASRGEELKAAIEEDRLALLLVERVLGGRYSAREIEERTGLPAAQMLRIRRLLGLPEASPDDRVFGEEEVDAAKSISLFLEAGLERESKSPLLCHVDHGGGQRDRRSRHPLWRTLRLGR